MKAVSRLGERMVVLAVTVCCILLALTVLNGCGGGGGGGHVPESSGIRNTAGVDVRDTWKPTGPVKSYFGLEQGGDGPRIVGFDSSGYSALGSKDGITYGQRMSGPTDTIDIDFAGHFDQLSDYVQGALERAGKSWSYRLKDVLGPHVTWVVGTPDGKPREVDGLLIHIFMSRNIRLHPMGVGSLRERISRPGRHPSIWRLETLQVVWPMSLLMRSVMPLGMVEIRIDWLSATWTTTGAFGPARH